MPHRLFCYGTLQLPDIVAAATGREPPGTPAALPGYACYAVRGAVYPAAVPERGARIEGTLYEGLSPRELARLDRYEGPEYRRRRVRVDIPGGDPREAWVYLWRERYRRLLSAERWSLRWFEENHRARYVSRLKSGTG